MTRKPPFSKQAKITCPYCGEKGKFRLYEGYEDNTEFGKCERVNSCGYFKSPNGEKKSNTTQQKQGFEEKDLEVLYLDKTETQKAINTTTSNFHIFCAKKGIPLSHLKKWNIGSTGKKGEQTAFFFQNKKGDFCNQKIGFYDAASGKRDKNFGFYSLKQPYQLKTNPSPQKYTLPLFGEHQLTGLDPKTKICVVESEKTAVIASYYCPEICFIACGSANGITSDKVKTLLVQNPLYWLCDADIAGRGNSSIDKLRTRTQYDTYIVDVFPNKNDGWDLADEYLQNPSFNLMAILNSSTPLKKETRTDKEKRTTNNEEDIIFWELKNYDLKIVSVKFSEFLSSKGFMIYENPDGEYEPIYIKDKVIQNVNVRFVKSFVKNFIQNEIPYEIINETIDKKNGDQISIIKTTDDLLNKLMDGENTFMSKTRFGWLEKFSGKIQRDTKNESYIFFKNGFLKIEKQTQDVDIDFLPYEKLENYIFQSSIRDYEFQILNDTEILCDFSKFIYNISGKDKKKQVVMMQTIGYLLHTYKNPAFPVAIIFGDEGLNTSEKGGRGKSLIMDAIGKVRNMVMEDGKKIDLNYAHLYDKVNENTNIFYFDDVNAKFDFNKLFSELSGDMSINPKGKKTYKIPYANSPKFAISTNYVIEGDNDSSARRMREIELAPYYSKQLSPAKDLGRMFFSDWDSQEWNKFFNFMGRCLIEYFYTFQSGIPQINPDNTNIALKKLLQETSKYDGFVEFADTEIICDNKYDKKDLFKKFITLYSDYEHSLQQRTFTEMLRKYAKYKGWEHAEAKSDSTFYITFFIKK